MKCLITGGAGGIGSAIARLLCKEGHSLHLVDSSDKIVEIARDLKSTFSICDLTEAEAIKDLFNDLSNLPDIVINAVGKGYWGNFESIPKEYFEKSFDTNFFAPLFVGLTAAKHWRENGISGKIITISSISGHRVSSPSTIAYATAKHALESGMSILRDEVSKYGLKVGTICPGNVDTMFWDNREMLNPDPMYNRQNMLKAEDVALHTYAWLKSPNPPFNVFIPKKRALEKSCYGISVRPENRKRWQKLTQAGHAFPPQSGIAIVTGASSGLGKELSKRLSINDWKVIAIARNLDRLNAVRNELGSDKIEIFSGDVSDGNRIDGILRNVITKFGKIDLIVNNAGATLVGCCLDLALEDIRRVFNMNFYGYYNLNKQSLNYIKESRGTILNVESTTALWPHQRGLPYSCAKIAQTVVSDTLKDDFLPYGIRVLDIFPGNIRTEFFQNAETADGNIFKVPDDAITVESVGAALISLLYGRKFTLIIPKPKHYLKRSNIIVKTAKAYLPHTVISMLRRIREKLG